MKGYPACPSSHLRSASGFEGQEVYQDENDALSSSPKVTNRRVKEGSAVKVLISTKDSGGNTNVSSKINAERKKLKKILNADLTRNDNYP